MLDVAYIRENRELVKEGMSNKGEPSVEMVDRVLEYDEKWRSLVQEVEQLRNESNTKSKKIGELMGQGKKDEAQEIIEYTSKLKEKIKTLEEDLEA